MSTPRLRRIVTVHAALRAGASANCSMRLGAGARHRRIRPCGFSGIRFTCAPPRKPREATGRARRPGADGRSRPRCTRTRTSPADPWRRRTRGRVEHLGDRVAAVQRHERRRAASSSGACSETASVTGSGKSREAAHAGYDADGRHGDVTGRRARASCAGVSNDSSTASTFASGSPMPMKTTLPTRCGDACCARSDLLDDLAGVEVTFEAGLAGRAERAAHRAAGLRRDAHGGSVPVSHEHGLDLRAVGRAATATSSSCPSSPVCDGDRRERERQRVVERGRAGPCASVVSVVERLAVATTARRTPGRRGSAARRVRRSAPRTSSRSRRSASLPAWSSRRDVPCVRTVDAVHREAERSYSAIARVLSASTNSMPVSDAACRAGARARRSRARGRDRVPCGTGVDADHVDLAQWRCVRRRGGCTLHQLKPARPSSSSSTCVEGEQEQRRVEPGLGQPPLRASPRSTRPARGGSSNARLLTRARRHRRVPGSKSRTVMPPRPLRLLRQGERHAHLVELTRRLEAGACEPHVVGVGRRRTPRRPCARRHAWRRAAPRASSSRRRRRRREHRVGSRARRPSAAARSCRCARRARTRRHRRRTARRVGVRGRRESRHTASPSASCPVRPCTAVSSARTRASIDAKPAGVDRRDGRCGHRPRVLSEPCG